MSKMSEDKGLYIVMISVHGLIRGHEMELGRDADTGGQTKYVVEVTRALSELDEVEKIDLITRVVKDRKVSTDYAELIEPIADKARIVRIAAAPKNYIPKEALWDHLDGFADNVLEWLNSQERLPDVIHSHYADAGYIGVRISNVTGIPLAHTGHSLGRDKLRRLLASGVNLNDIEERYNMSRRIEAEEGVLASASLIVTSTHNEIEDQYELYDYYQPDRMSVVPPGTNLNQFYPPGSDSNESPLTKTLRRFLQDPSKPMILALSRPDGRKNILALFRAFGESPQLREIANLVVAAGSREDIKELESGAQSVLTEMLLLTDYYDLYGQVAIPKHLKTEEVPEIYQQATRTKGVFINPALTEPFGLTILEAAACGMPIVATENGGPVDIIGNCNNGLLVDPLDEKAMAAALLEILSDPAKWDEYSKNSISGVRKYYSWSAHARAYLEKLKPILERREHRPVANISRESLHYHDRALFTDVDQNLLGNPEGLKCFVEVIRSNHSQASFGVATGRRLDSALAIFKKCGIPIPDVLITSLGTEIHYAPELTVDRYWREHIDHLWQPKAVRRLLAALPGLTEQHRDMQSYYKLSYLYDLENAPSMEEINSLLRQDEQTVNTTYSFGQFLDIIPIRASKGLALRHFAQQWNIPLERILVAGGSGADEDMMRGNTLAAVVANRHQEDLSALADLEHVYFTKQSYALGILEAINHYDFFKTCIDPKSNAST